MSDTSSQTPLVIRLATTQDIPQIEELDSFSNSPTRHIHRAMEKYFGSVEPSVHEQTLIFLAESADIVLAKAELMLAPLQTLEESSPQPTSTTGYIKRVIVRPDCRKQGLARKLMQYIIVFARAERKLATLELHIWEQNLPAARLYESLGFEFQHRELYYRLPL